MHRLGSLVGLTLALTLGACAHAPAPSAPAPSTSTSDAAFVDRVWRVATSTSVAEGTIYIFVSDGTLLVTSPGTTPMLGQWSHSPPPDHDLVMTEQSIAYPVDILALTDDTFVIRSHNPGEPVDITLVPAAER